MRRSMLVLLVGLMILILAILYSAGPADGQARSWMKPLDVKAALGQSTDVSDSVVPVFPDD